MKCLYCGKDGCPDEWTYCNACGTNLKEYEKANDFIKNGLELEKQLKYTTAAEEYRKALKLNVPKDKILVHLQRVVRLEESIVRDMELGTEALKARKWGQAVKMYEKILKIAPYFEKEIMPNLMKARAMYKKRVKYRWIIISIAAVIALTGAIFLYRWASSPTQVALKTLKEGMVSEDASSKKEAIEIVGRLQDKRLVPLVREALKDKNAVIRTSAAKVLGELKDSLSIPILKVCLSDKNWEVRNEAAKALAIMGDTSGTEFLKRTVK